MAKHVRKLKGAARYGPERKLNSKCEFILMLMKIRLGLLNQTLQNVLLFCRTLCWGYFLRGYESQAQYLNH